MSGLLILRPEPGAQATLRRAQAIGLWAVATPLFTIRPLAWEQPSASDFDALLLTSANAARCGGPDLANFLHLPCYTVGEASAAAAREAGFVEVRAGAGTVADTAKAMAADGHCRVLHLCGREHVPASEPGLSVESQAVYAADAVEALPKAALDTLREGAVTLLHSARAAQLFARLVPDRSRLSIVAISQAVADASGDGWQAKLVAPEPTDAALLELAAKLCQTGRPSETE